MTNDHTTIKTNAAGIEAAKLSDRPADIPTVVVGGALGKRPAYAVDIGKGVTAYVRDGVGSAQQSRLIAAAPEMLEALRSIAEHVEGGKAISADWIERMARAAIAKATGGAL